MTIKERMSGNEAVAYAMKQIEPDVMAAFPITPSTEIPQYFSKYLANGLVNTEFIAVESEHSAMSACMGASAAGARATTATSSAGLAYMWEILYVVSASRLPVVMAVVNRALSGPININNDHSDSMGARDSGWIQLYSETNQEVYDNYIQAYLIAEATRLPVMVCQDGFITSHGVSNIELLEDKKVKDFVGDYVPENYMLKENSPMMAGPFATIPYYMEIKRAQAEAMNTSYEVIEKVATAFASLSGRSYSFFEEYMMEDAEVAIIIISSSAGTAKEAVNILRGEGKKVGLIKIRVFRPFPKERLTEALKGVNIVSVMDKADSYSGIGGPLYSDVKNSLYDEPNKPHVINYIYGLGGRDIKVEEFIHIFNDMINGTDLDDTYRYIGVRDKRGNI
jgi:pyruvate ferredoxin oxidoreductase alpha subunit